MQISGAQIIIECLVEQGVDTVFGYPGGAVLPLYDALYQNRDRIRHILTSHEQGAAHAADGYARSTGKVGVCVSTSGPGATNLVTGIATAYMDSVPLVALTGNVIVPLLGKDSFQEVDITGITMPITKHNFIVKDVKDLAPTMRRAFRIAQEGRPGPVLIDLPKDITVYTTDYERETIEAIVPGIDRLREKSLQQALELIKSSERPMCYVGGGAIRAKASEELSEFLTLIDSPACTSLMGSGAISSLDARFTGLVGMHGTKVSNMLVSACDLLIVIGARFSDRVVSKASSFARNARIIHIDVDPAEIDKNIKSYCNVVGDVKVVLSELNRRLESPISHPRWMEQVADYKRRYPIRVDNESARSKEILKALQSVLPPNFFIVTEVGQHQMWAAQFLKHVQPGHFLTSGGLGTMGYGTGAAIGAQVGNPKSRVVNVAGDGSFRMNCNELATIARYRLPIVILLMNNKTLGMVRQWQTLFFSGNYSETTLDTPIDWMGLAAAYGVKGMRLGKDDDPQAVLKAALDLGEAVLVDCEIPVDDKVYPMVAPGAPIDEMLGVPEPS
ncbi:MAG TPA: biosynthetic-type acetolactate synthase large subunit [Sphaerochaeta sp.]|jgi:acetolactate synthase-1/2/3 large subunit|nr:biosynthetic-type acetolactate synthase large subunit [Spirochaetota bacterium]HOE84433.1 biosynthetic-type acetolactate synthase large subunit [Sphaerochaeta sp.]HOQ94102.1 biosynthetic-type acetolactate synthase large subunit [Sphaerochaeta sp.]HPK47472.1 biosynthetic-type acetolactate synthase large subunit [Sphaerochaeta sp.]